MKALKKIMALLLVMISLLGCVACGGDNVDSDDPSGEGGGGNGKKETLWIGNYDGASGHKWLDHWIAEYQKIPGNENVKIFVENKKEEFGLSKLCADMPYSDNDIYFLDQVYYKDLVRNDLVEDITDIVTEKIYNDKGDFPAAGETATKSIIDMMYPEYAEFMNVGTKDAPQYFSTPFSFPISGITYDADLFNDNRWFFDKNGEIGVKKTDPNVGPGPDGKFETTYDNGEPETWNDFATLLNQILSDGCTPFTWCGQYWYQRQYFQKAVMADYMGYDDMRLFSRLSGTHSELGEITPETAYKLLDSQGVLAACYATKEIMKNSQYYSSLAFNQLTQSHTQAQAEYVYSVESAGKQIAMFIESSYWEQEATSSFDEMSELDSNYAFGKRNFAYMSMPKFKGVSGITDSKNTMTTLYGEGSGKPCVINKYSKQKERAKDFFKFVHSRTANASFTALSNTIRPFTYDLTDAEYQSATPLMKSVIDRFVDTDNVNVVIYEKFNPILVNSTSLDIYWNVGGSVGNTGYIDYFSILKDNPAFSYIQLRDAIKAKTTKEVWEKYVNDAK